jgi:hypothetical protein
MQATTHTAEAKNGVRLLNRFSANVSCPRFLPSPVLIRATLPGKTGSGIARYLGVSFRAPIHYIGRRNKRFSVKLAR